MLLPDVNILVYAHRVDMEGHVACRDWLSGILESGEGITLPDLVAVGFLRIVSDPRVFRAPSTLEDARTVVEAIYASPGFYAANSGPKAVSRMLGIAPGAPSAGSTTTDAYIASIALEMGATLVTADRGFARYVGLSLFNPIA